MTTRSILIVLAAISVAFYAFVNPTNVSHDAAFTVLMIVLFFYSMAIVTSSGLARAYCVGFASVGWFYLLVHALQWFSASRDGRLTPHLLTHAIAEDLVSTYQEMFEPPERASFPLDASIRYWQRVDACQIVFALLFAMIGGMIASLWYAKAARRQQKGN